MKVMITGSREWRDPGPILHALREAQMDIAILPEDMMLLHGDARGCDRLGARLARSLGWNVESYPADWRTHGRAAGAIRNRRMLTVGKPELVLAFPLPSSRGTYDAIRQARQLGIRVRVWKG
jgi:hypothetical protein